MKRKLSLNHSVDPEITAKINGEPFSKIKFQSLMSVVEKSLDDDRIWVSDFRNDEIFVTNDLYDMIAAYHHFYREIKDSA